MTSHEINDTNKKMRILSKVFSVKEKGRFTTESTLYSATTLYDKLIYSSDIIPSEQKYNLIEALLDFIIVYGEQELKKLDEASSEALT